MNAKLIRRFILLSCALLSLSLTLPARAALGETHAEIARRLGPGQAYRARGGWEQRQYPKNGLTTYVVFIDDRSIWELTKRDKKEITDADIKKLLTENSKPGNRFIWNEGGKYYMREDGRAKAEKQPRHNDFFSIMETEAIQSHEDVSDFGSLGEAKEEVAKRYGPGEPYTPRDGMEQLQCGKHGYTIQVVFRNGKSVWELFKREDTDYTSPDVEHLLAAEGGDFTWDEKDQCYYRDHRKVKACRQPGHPDFFSVMDVDAVGAGNR